MIKQGILTLVVTLVSFFYFASYCDNARLASDPVDYIGSASHGFWPAYLDTGSITPWALYSAIRNQRDPHAWEYLEGRGDPAPARHFHVALSFYPYAIATDLNFREPAQRLVTAAEGALGIGIAFSGLLLAGTGVPLALAAAFLTTLSPSIVATFTDPSPHTLFLSLMLAFGFSLAAGLKSQSKSGVWRHAAIILFALLFATLELSIVVAVAAIAVLVIRALQGHRSKVSGVARAVLIGIATLILAWPGGVIRGGYLLSYSAFLFQATVRRSSYYGSASLAATLMAGNEMSVAVVVVLAVVAVATVVLMALNKSNPYLDVFAWLTLGFAVQGYLNRFHNATYVAHFSALRWILLALCARQWINVTRSRWARGAVFAAVVLAGLGAVSWPAASRRMRGERDVFSERAGKAMDYIRGHLPAGTVIVTNTERGIWRYYIPAYRIEPTITSDSIRPQPVLGLRDYWALVTPGTLNGDWRKGVAFESETMVAGFGIYKCHLLP